MKRIEIEGSKPCARNSHQLIADECQKVIFLFGGANEKGALNDFWKFDIENSTWEQLQLPKSIKAREIHACCLIPKESFQYILNSKNNQTNSVSNKLVTLNIESTLKDDEEEKRNPEEQKHTEEINELSQKIKKVNLTLDKENEVEPEINEENVVQKENHTEEIGQVLAIIGGHYMSDIYDEIIFIDTNSCKIIHEIKLPFPITALSAVFLNDFLIINGGTSGAEFIKELILLDFQKGTFHKLNHEKLKPRIASTSTVLSDNLLLFYGGSTYDKELNDIFTLDLSVMANLKLEPIN